MALIYPSKLGVTSKERALAYRAFKKLSDEFRIWFSTPDIKGSIAKDGAPSPDCFILYKKRFGFIIHISHTNQQAIDRIIQQDIFDNETSLTLDQLGDEESVILETFCENLRLQIESDIPLKKLVIFPSVKHHSIEALSIQKTDKGMNFLGIDKLKEETLTNYFTKLAGEALPEPYLLQLRRTFSPESVVPSTFSALSSISALAPRKHKSPDTIHHQLLDLDQEWCMKNDLHLSEEASQELEESTAAPKNKNQLITGIAGCGKSLILLYRALYNAKLAPDAKILVLTHNRPLISELQSRGNELSSQSRNLKYSTFFQWAISELHKTNNLKPSEKKILSLWETKSILSKQLFESAQSKTTKLTTDFLAEEIGWIKDHNIRQLQDYLDIQRNGRGGALQSGQRKEVWKHFDTYQRTLDKAGQLDWHGVALRFHDAVTSGQVNFPSYDCILIDEAQFFAKAWFDIVNAAVKQEGQIFLAADPTQGFLKRKQSWIASGIDVRGRTKKLKKPYRNSRAILSFASQFFKERSASENSESTYDLNISSQKQIDNIPIAGSAPEIIFCNSQQGSLHYISNEIKNLHTAGLENNKILIIHNGNSEKNISYLTTTLGNKILVHDTSKGSPKTLPFVKICQLYAATGLEAPIIFLLGIDSVLEKEGDPTLSEDLVAEIKRDNTRLLYMAFTRAGQKLIIMTENSQTEQYLKQLITVKASI